MELERGLLAIGAVLLLGLAADALGRRVHVPRVTLLILLGLAFGPSGFDLLPPELRAWREPLTVVALTMVAFALGGELTGETLRAQGRAILRISAAVAGASAALVAGGLLAFGAPAPVALMLGGVATATDPAATQDVAAQSGAKGPFASRLLGIVAIDDAWGVIAFGLLLVGAGALNGDGGGAMEAAAAILRELGGSALVGVAVGAPAAFLTGRIRPGEPTRLEALGVVFLCAGLAMALDLSFLLAGMTAGVVVANFAPHHERPFREIENMQGPWLLLFFVLAGAAVELPEIGGVLGLCAGFAGLRAAGRLLGGLAGGAAAGLQAREGLWTGAALMPQAGVALGMALIAADRFPEHGAEILAVTVATTVLFEVAGPLLTQLALARCAGTRG